MASTKETISGVPQPAGMELAVAALDAEILTAVRARDGNNSVSRQRCSLARLHIMLDSRASHFTAHRAWGIAAPSKPESPNIRVMVSQRTTETFLLTSPTSPCFPIL